MNKDILKQIFRRWSNWYNINYYVRILDSVGYILVLASNINYQECFAEAIAQYYCSSNYSKLSE